MPSVQIDFAEGRTIEQKRELVQKVTQAICEAAKCSPESVEITIRDLPLHNFAVGGKLLSDK